MKKFLVAARSCGETVEEYVSIVQDYLTEHGATVIVDVQDSPDGTMRPIEVPDGIECLITVGGDGTVVRAAQTIARTDVPILGLNCGHLGYLCDMTVDNAERCMDLLLEDKCKIDKRIMLEGCYEGKKYTALNDIVVSSRNTGISVLNLKVSVNGIQLYSHNCDGLILATPTGSTAYNLSANGPIVSPHSDCIILTPLNPHTLNSRSIILSSKDEIEIELGLRHETDKAQATIIYDGLNRQTLNIGSTLRVYKSKNTTKMVMFENVNFLERIRARMQEI